MKCLANVKIYTMPTITECDEGVYPTPKQSVKTGCFFLSKRSVNL